MKEIYKNLLQEEILNLNQKFNPDFKFKIGDKGFSFDDIYPDYKDKNIFWAKLFILNSENVQIGRITYKFENGKMIRFYIKQYKPLFYEYDKNDNIFYFLEFFFKNKQIPNFDQIVTAAKTIKEFYIAKHVIWRINNPYKSQEKISKSGKIWKTHRKKIQGRKIRVIIEKLVKWIIGEIQNPFPEFEDYIKSLNGKPNNSRDLFLYFY